MKFIFLSKVEYNDQLNTQTSIHISPLLKLKEIIFCISACEIIVGLQILTETTRQLKYICFFDFHSDEKIIIIGGIAAAVKLH